MFSERHLMLGNRRGVQIRIMLEILIARLATLDILAILYKLNSTGLAAALSTFLAPSAGRPTNLCQMPNNLLTAPYPTAGLCALALGDKAASSASSSAKDKDKNSLSLFLWESSNTELPAAIFSSAGAL